MGKKNKNKSNYSDPLQTPLGRTFQTFDIVDNKNTKLSKPRRVVVVETNENNEFGIVSLTTQNTHNSTELPNYKSSNKKKTYFKHFLEITDKYGNPIVKGSQFLENHKNNDVSSDDVNKITTTLYSPTTKQYQRNIKKRSILKNRTNKKPPKQ